MALKLHDFRVGTRFALALALPMAGLLFLSIWILVGYYRTANDMERLRQLAEIASAASSLVHAVQKERGVSAGFMGSAGSSLAERLPVRYRESDAQRAAFARLLAGFDASSIGENMTIRVALAQDKLNRIGIWRSALAERTIKASELTDYYSGVIEALIGIIEEMRFFSTNAALTRTISAHTNIMHAKEFAGLERALGVAGFAAGDFDPVSRARFIQLIERQNLCYKEFLLFATAGQALLLDQAFTGFDAPELERIRQVVTDSGAADAIRRVDAAHWFDTISQKIDRLKTVEDGIAAELVAMASQTEISAKRAAWGISALAAILLALTTALAAMLARGIIHPLIRITDSMSKLAARDESIEIGDVRCGDEIGALARALVVFRDNLHKVAQAEERLKNESILRLHNEALDAISQGVLITDAQYRITYANPAFLRISGYAEAEILGGSLFFLLNKGGDAKMPDKLRETLACAHHFHGHLLNYRKDGTPFWSDLSINSVLDSENRPAHFVGVISDITENRLQQQELRIAATAFESLHGIMVTDTNGVILRVNKAFSEMTGYSAAEAVGQTPAILKSGRHEAGFYAEMWRQLAATGAWYGEIWDRRKNGEIFPKWQTISTVNGPDGRISHYVAAFSDISERKAAEDEIRHLAFSDPLTQLPNRRLLLDRLRQAMAVSARNRRNGALLFIDLDNFKNLNDTFGHDKGDLLLQQVAERLTHSVREGDTVARLGGDEFVLMLENLSDDLPEAAAHAQVVGKKILDALNQPYQLVSHECHSTPSIGITLFRGHDISVDELLKQADLAMYQAKAAGRNTLRFFQPVMQATVTARSILELDLRKGLREKQFFLVYQPQVMEDGRMTGVEALVRWRHPLRGLVSPNDFIPLAEETGLILPLGQWVLETACNLLVDWAENATKAHLTMAVNVSARQFNHADFVEQVLATLDHTGANAHRLKFELTESLFLDNVDETIGKMSALRKRGVSFSLDDFGTGYSSLSYLKRLPLDQLKIDQSFVRNVITDPNDAVIARTIVALGQSMGLAIIAEGVETREQQGFLARQGCLAYQGYLFSRPLPLEALEQYMNDDLKAFPAQDKSTFP